MKKLALILLFLGFILPAKAEIKVTQDQDYLYFSGLQGKGKYTLQMNDYVEDRKITTDDCGILTIKNSEKYPFFARGNYFEFKVLEANQWYWWQYFEDSTYYPMLVCQKVKGTKNDFLVIGNIRDNGNGRIGFVVDSREAKIYHPNYLKPNTQYTVRWYGEWMGVNYNNEVKKNKSFVTNDCGVGKVSLKDFKEKIWTYRAGQFSFNLLQNQGNLLAFDPVTVTQSVPPLCRKGVTYFPK